MKKITLLFALLCASVMGWATINWDAVDYLGSTEPSISMNTYKYALDPDDSEAGPNSIANIQPASGESRLGFYSTYEQGVASCSHAAKILGDQVWVYVDQLTELDTKIVVTLSDASTRAFHLYYKNGGAVDPNAPHPSGKGFGTYIAKNVPFYTRVNNKADETQTPLGYVDLYMLTYGNKLMAKATLKNSVTFNNDDYSMQFRIWNDAQTDFSEKWAQLREDSKATALINMSSDYCNLNVGTRTELPINTYMATSANTGAVPMFMYTLDYINAPAAGDEDAPVITSAAASYNPLTNQPKIVITATDANDMFYKIVAPDNSVTYSFSNEYELVTDESGDVHTYTVYAIDFNGNTSSSANVDVQMKPALSNIALNQAVTAGINQDKAGRIVDGNFGGNRWSSQGAIHYDPVNHPDDYQDWFYINFINIYDLNAVRIKWETARPNNYTFRTSIDGSTWTTVATYTEYPAANDITDYILPANTQGRFFGVWATSGYNNLGYGISPYEVEVYGSQAASEDHNPPTLTSAVLSGDPAWNQVNIAVEATDAEDGDVYICRVIESTYSIDQMCTISAGIITVTGLEGETTYNFSVTAVDAAGNESSPIVVNATTAIDTTVPQVAAPEPAQDEADVLPIYTDAYATILKHDFVKHNWGSVNEVEKVIAGDHHLVYNMPGGNAVVWGQNDASASAIVAKDGYNAGGDGSNTGIDAHEMEKLHVDIWSQVAMNNIEVRINDQLLRRINLTNEGWQSFDILLAEPLEAVILTSVRWMKFTNITDANRQKIAIDNVYFWRAPVDDSKHVNAFVNDDNMGTAVVQKAGVDVTTVDDGDEVSFIATPNEGYRFINWTKNNVEVSTSATYVTTITETTNLVANFDYIRNTYCHYEVVSNASAVQGKKLYITVGALGGGQYQIKFEGSAEAQLTGLNNANYTINWVTTDIVDGDKKMSGQDVPFNNARWAFDASGYGSATATFGIAEGHTWEDIHVWNHAIYFSTASGELGYTSFPERYHIAWTEQCADTEAPVMAAPVGAALNTTDVRLTLSATDNWEGIITYNVNYKPVGDAGDGIDVTPAPTGASGEEISVDVLGLTTNTSYIFTVTAKDAANNTCDAQSCTVTPAGDVTAPTNVTVSAMALTDHIVRLTLYADDDFAGDITYNIAYDNAGVASTSAAQGTTTTLDIAGLDADADYHFVVVATDAANNSADAVNAVLTWPSISLLMPMWSLCLRLTVTMATRTLVGLPVVVLYTVQVPIRKTGGTWTSALCMTLRISACIGRALVRLNINSSLPTTL